MFRSEPRFLLVRTNLYAIQWMVRGNLTIYEADIAETHRRGLTYILGEMNSIACHGAPGVSNTAGAALWTIEFTLQAATLGIKELFFHEGIGYKYNFMQPISLNRSIVDGSPLDPPAPPHIQPPFYGGLVVNTFVGHTGGAFEVQGRRAILKRLVIEHADDTEGLTWAGQSYENSNVSPEGKLATEEVDLSEGFDIRSTCSSRIPDVVEYKNLRWFVYTLLFNAL
ncbi:hypothetical protein GSI_15140 [Ganoderma sinense ZZ0214-1]|uniref:Uncharacterized protein n=1 Tax=Ganoderma sinense ZZ0214-1 TaxID=1077348 RepID=A0A2G8RLR6_9APHY|nr:hypothetical protein GSI_15140 [Ganoderma sinense ZZ0214-1]